MSPPRYSFSVARCEASGTTKGRFWIRIRLSISSRRWSPGTSKWCVKLSKRSWKRLTRVAGRIFTTAESVRWKGKVRGSRCSVFMLSRTGAS